MSDISDTVMTLAAVACFAEASTTIRNVAHVRHKETDRLTALAALELRKFGVGVEEFADGLTLFPWAAARRLCRHLSRPSSGHEPPRHGRPTCVPGVIINDPGCAWPRPIRISSPIWRACDADHPQGALCVPPDRCLRPFCRPGAARPTHPRRTIFRSSFTSGASGC